MATPMIVVVETQIPEVNSVPTTISAPDRPSDYLNDVQILSIDTFDDPGDSQWNMDSGTIENGVMNLAGNQDWRFSYWNGEFGVNEGMVIDFNFSASSLSEIFLEYGVWNTDEYRRFGVYLGEEQANVNQYRGDENQDFGGSNLSGNLALQPGQFLRPPHQR